MADIKVQINQCGIPSIEPIELYPDDEIEWNGGSGIQWEIDFIRGPNPGKKSPFAKDKFKLNEKTGKRQGTQSNQEYKYNITGVVKVTSSVKGEEDRELRITVDPTVIIRP